MKQSKLRNKDSGRDPTSFWLEKKTSMPVPVKWLWDITRYSWSSTIHNKNLSDSMRYLYQTIYSWIRSLETILEMRKETWFRKLLNKNILSKFSKYVANNRKNTYGSSFKLCTSLEHFQDKNHKRDFLTMWKTKFLQMHYKD